MLHITGGLKAAIVLSCMLALGACTKKSSTSLEDGSANGDGDTAGLDGDGGAMAALPGSEKDFQTNVGDKVYFLIDQSALTEEGKQTLRAQAAWLQKYDDVTLQIEGHSDERGTREYNIALSARRATATRNFLVAQGIPPKRIASIAFGKERPAAICDAEQCWSQNRRSVTVITGGAKTS